MVGLFVFIRASIQISIHCLDASVIVMDQFGYFDIPQMGFPTRKLRVVVEQIPFAIVLYDGMMVCPAVYRGEDYTFVSERTVGAIANRISNVMGVPSGVGEIIFAVEFVHPGGFEEATVGICAKYRDSAAIKNLDVFWRLRKLQHVIAQARNFRAERRFITRGVFVFCNVAAAYPAL